MGLHIILVQPITHKILCIDLKGRNSLILQKLIRYLGSIYLVFRSKYV